MTASPQTRDLAHRLLAYETGAARTSDPMESPAHRVYEKLRQNLSAFAGAAAFESLASRALSLAKSETPALGAVQIAADGSLRGLGEIETQTDMDKNRAGGIILIARLLGLLRIFLGEAITLNLLRNAWPGEAFDDRNSAHGGKS